MVQPNIERDRYIYRLPRSKARVEIIREIVLNDSDSDYMDVSDYEPN